MGQDGKQSRFVNELPLHLTSVIATYSLNRYWYDFIAAPHVSLVHITECAVAKNVISFNVTTINFQLADPVIRLAGIQPETKLKVASSLVLDRFRPC